MASSQVRAASLPLPARSPLIARRTKSCPAVLSSERLFYSTEAQSPPPEDLERLFVPIISIDHLSQDFKDLPVDDILALGDQALLYQLLSSPISSEQTGTSVSGIPERSCAGADGQSYASWLYNLKTHWELKEGYKQYIENEKPSLDLFRQTQCLLSNPITEPAVLGPLINNLYYYLATLKERRRCEFLLYLSGHGIDPGNICLVPKAMRPHPTRPYHDLREIDPDKWYKYDGERYKEEATAEDNLKDFYCKYTEAFGDYSGPLGFVGGEVYAHHRGFIGVLGVLGLWCHAHRECEGDTDHHLVIVADCCFAGIWGATLECIMRSEGPCLKEYRKLLLRYPVSIQCATNEFEASNAGLFTPLWYFLQTATEQQLDTYRAAVNKSEPVSDDEMDTQASPKREPAVTQHPWYVSTSSVRPSWKFFNDSTLFVDLHGAQLKQLEEYVLPGEVRQDNCPPLVRPFRTVLKSEAKQLRDMLEDQLRKLELLERDTELRDSQVPVAHSVETIKQSSARLRDLLFNAIPRSQRPLRHFVLDQPGNKLSKANREQLKKTVQPRGREERVIHPGVYVFQGGEGDMSLIVTPGQEQVILIDGTKTADCFEAAWHSVLKYLTRITMIFVTHHDEDHTFGIQLLLARYSVKPTDTLPDISRTIIYMNTRAALRRRSFGHEEEIEALANKLDLPVEPFIINRHCLCVDLHMEKDFFLAVLLPRQQLVDECRGKVPEKDQSTGPVSSRGRTTAANVLSTNLVAVWKKRDAYLFTGDAHLKDVTQAAQDFLHIHPMKSFKYVDVPHHGSAKSNVDDVDKKDHGLARIPAEHYLISHCGNHQNPSLTTVTHILKWGKCRKLHFLYPARRQPVACSSCQECGNNVKTRNWHCECVIDFRHMIDTALHDDGPFKFFPFN